MKRIPNHLFENAGFDNYDLVIPAGIEELGAECFYSAKGVKSLAFAGTNLKEIGVAAFGKLTDLESVTIPASVTKIRSSAFDKCSKLSTVDIRSTQLEDCSTGGSFEECKISSLTFSGELKHIPNHLFENSGFVNCDLVIPAGVETIGVECFYNVTGINSLTFVGNSLKEVGTDAFKKCSSLSGILRVPASVTSIGNSAFDDCNYECIVNNSTAAIKLPLKTGQTWVDYETKEVITSIAEGIAIIQGSTIDPGVEPIEKYTVTYNANGGTGTVPVDENEYNAGDNVTILGSGDLAKADHEFKGWCEDSEGKGKIYKQNDVYAAINNNLVLYAIWKEKGAEPEPAVYCMVLGQKINLRETCFADITEVISRFTVSDTKLASVSKETFSGKKPGKVTVYAQKMISKNNYENIAECEVTILNKPKLKFTRNMTYLGQTINGTDYFQTEDIRTYGATYWESSKPGIIEVTDSSNGVLQAKGNGTAKITAYFGEKGKPGTFKISTNLSVKVPLFAKADYSMQTGAKLTITMKNVNGALDPEWITADEGIARASAQLNNKGVKTGKVIVEGLKYGDTTLTATIDGQTYNCTIHVTAPEINKTDMTLSVGKTGTVSLKKTKIKKTDIRWQTDDPEVAIVDENGKITAKKAGNAIIYTETGGKRNECHVTVK